MKRSIVALTAVLLAGAAGHAAAQTYTSRSAFLAANPEATTIEDFESVPAAQRDRGLASLIRPNISFAPGSGGQDVYVFSATPASNEFAPGVVTTASEILTADGLEHIVGTLTTASSALGFDVLLTDVNNLVVRFYSGATMVDSITFLTDNDASNNYTFAGIRSAAPITGFTFDITSGPNRYDSGLDNILAVPAAVGVPEPASWATMLAGAAVAGGALRRRRSRVVAVA